MQHSGDDLLRMSQYDTNFDVKPLTMEHPPHTHSGSDSGVSDMTSSDRSMMDVDGSSQSPQGQLTTSASSVSSHRPSDSSESTASIGKEVFSSAVIDTLLSQVIQESKVDKSFEQPMESQPTEQTLNLSLDIHGSTHDSSRSSFSSVTHTHEGSRSALSNASDEYPDAFTEITSNMVDPSKMPLPEEEYDPSLDFVFEDDLGESAPCDLSAQEPSSSTEKDQDLDLKSMVTRGSSVRCSSPSGDSDLIGSSVDEDNSYLLAKSYKTVEKLYLEKFSLQQAWVEKAYEVINGNLKVSFCRVGFAVLGYFAPSLHVLILQ